LSVLFLIWLIPAIESEAADHTPELSLSTLEQSQRALTSNDFQSTTSSASNALLQSLFETQSRWLPNSIYLRVDNNIFVNNTQRIASLRDIEILVVCSTGPITFFVLLIMMNENDELT
jgi:hypothetical protein